MVTLTHNIRIGKNAIFQMICKARTEDTNLSKVDMDSLINYFAPPIPKKPKVKEQWVALAVGKKDKRSVLNFLHVSNGKLWATDDHRMHWCDTDLADGFYCPKTLFAVDNEPGPYPEVTRVIPQKFETDSATLTRDDWSIELNGKVRRALLNDHPQYVFQECLLLDALSAGDVKYQLVEGGMMKGESVHGEFVIMGLSEKY